MLKTTVLTQVLLANEVLTADKIGNIEGGDELIEKSGKLLKTGKLSKRLKLTKFKKLSKNGDSPNFDVKETGLSFLTPKARTTFNRLWLTFTKAPIL